MAGQRLREGRDLRERLTCGMPAIPPATTRPTFRRGRRSAPRPGQPGGFAWRHSITARSSRSFASWCATASRCWCFPATASAEEVRERRPDGVFLSNGPGDPAALPHLYPAVTALLPRLSGLRHLPRAPDDHARPGGLHLQAEVRPPRRQPAGQEPRDRKGVNHRPKPRVRHRSRAASRIAGPGSPRSTSTTRPSKGCATTRCRSSASSTTRRPAPGRTTPIPCSSISTG